MKIEDMKHWNTDQLKEEVVRLSEECEKKQHEILDLKSSVKNLQKQLVDFEDFIHQLDYNKTLKETTGFPITNQEWYESRHQDDCIRINQLTVTINTLVDMLARLRENQGLN